MLFLTPPKTIREKIRKAFFICDDKMNYSLLHNAPKIITLKTFYFLSYHAKCYDRRTTL